MASAPTPRLDTVRLTPGRHDSPRDGACVVELASLIAGEEFSDRPRCVCPVIGAFLRAWNDRAAYADRQRLRPYAERVIGSRAPAAIARQRREICLEWAGADLDRGPVGRVLSRTAMRFRIAAFVGIREALRVDEGAPEYAARLLIGRRDLSGAFLLLDAMLAIGHAAGDGGSVVDEPVVAAPVLNGNGHVPSINGNGRLPAGVNGNGNGNGASPTAKRPSSSRSD